MPVGPLKQRKSSEVKAVHRRVPRIEKKKDKLAEFVGRY
jgi:hypothetical protein